MENSHRDIFEKKNMCYYQLYIFLHCGHSTSSQTPVGFCKDAEEDRTLHLDLQAQRLSTMSTASSVYSMADSLDAEKKDIGQRAVAKGRMRPCTEGRVHPLQTRRLERLCASCQHKRERRLEVLQELSDRISFEPWQWQFKYQGGSTSLQQDVLSKEAAQTCNTVTTATEWDVATTVSSFITSSSGWMKDRKRQGNDKGD